MSNLRLHTAEKQPINISAPTFLDQITQFLPSITNDQAFANTGVQTQVEQIGNAVNQIRNTQDPEAIKKYVQRIDAPLKQILSIINTKMPQGANVPSNLSNALNTVKTFGDQIAKWNKSVGIVPALPPQPAQIVPIPPKPFSARLKGPRNIQLQNITAPRTPKEWQEAQSGEKESRLPTQEPQATRDEVDSAAKEVSASHNQEIKMARMGKRIDKSENEWMGLFETSDGYIFASGLKSRHIVAVLGYKETDEGVSFVGRFENVPCHDTKVKLVSLTGMIEDDEDPADAAVRETAEESGVEIDKDDLIDLGTVRPSKAMDTTFHLFGVNIHDATPGVGPGDGTDGEEGTYCKLVSMKEVLKSEDAILHSLLIRLLEYIE